MTDSPREEPRPDRLPEVHLWLLRKNYLYQADKELVAWLVAEVERLRGEVRDALLACDNWKVDHARLLKALTESEARAALLEGRLNTQALTKDLLR